MMDNRMRTFPKLLQCDPCEMHSVYGDPRYAALTAELTDLLHDHQAAVGDRPHVPA